MDPFERFLIILAFIFVILFIILDAVTSTKEEIRKFKEQKLGDFFDRLMLVQEYKYVEKIVNTNARMIIIKISKERMKESGILIDESRFYFIFTDFLQDLSEDKKLNYRFNRYQIAACLTKALLCQGKVYISSDEKKDEINDAYAFDLNVDIAINCIVDVVARFQKNYDFPKGTRSKLEKMIREYAEEIKKDYISTYEKKINRLLGIVNNEKYYYEDYCYEMDTGVLEREISKIFKGK